jgi:hypothetical protein
VRKRRQLGMERLVCSPARTSLTRVRLNHGGYDENGRYFGRGEPLFAYDNGESWGHLRAPTRAAAKAKLRAKCPVVKFYR